MKPGTGPSTRKTVAPPRSGTPLFRADDPEGPVRPPLKWAGGKRWQVPHLLPLWRGNEHRRLVEPFCGGLAVTLGLMPERALLNDVNPHLVNFYRSLKRGLTTDLEMKNRESHFYRLRSRFNALLANGGEETTQAAALFYYLNRTGYNGLCRFNRKGEFNVPFGRYAKINYRHDFSGYSRVFARWEFISGDFEDIRLEERDFVYADPPYDVEFTTYAKGGFSWDDQIRTAEWLAKHKGPIVLVNQATERIISLYETLGYRLSYLDAPRMINCTGDRTRANEVLALRNVVQRGNVADGAGFDGTDTVHFA
jgi:DNA adenine methylase